MRALLLYNPNATTTTPALTELITAALSAELKLDVEATKRSGHAGYLAAGAVHEGYDVVVALGGDGTVNEVVQGLARSPTKLALIPGGSTNVFARILGIPTDPVEATAGALRRIRRGEERTVPLGRANGRWFAFCAGWGYDAEVVRMVERRARMKRTVRQATFLWCGLLAELAGRAQQAEIVLRAAGDTETTGPLRTLVCCNANPYTYLGPLPSQMCPEADLDAGIDVTALDRTGLVALARVMRTALSTGNVGHLRFAHLWHDRARYEARATAPLPLHVDGEYMGESDELLLESVPAALTLVA